MEEQFELEQGLENQTIPNEKKKKKKEKKKEKKRGVWKVLVAVVLMVGIMGSVAVSSFTLLTLKEYILGQEEKEKRKEQEEKDKEKTKEDFVKIAEQYEIRPTKDISDAYKSGDTSALDDKQKETLDMAKSAIEEMKIKEGMSNFEKEKAVYDWMTTSLQQDRGALVVIPQTQQDCDNPYGVLKYHNAVCVGYATTFRMFMEMLDVECMVAHNNECWHSWNLVKLEDDWCITDVYSDAGNNTYAHFNMTDSMWGQEQSWDRDFFPAANSLKYNMSYRNKATVDTVYDVGSALRKAMNDKRSSVMVSFKESVNEDNARIVASMITSIDNALMMNNYMEMPMCLINWNWIKDPVDDSYLLCVYMGGYNSDNSNASELSEEEQAKVQDIVDHLFEDLSPQAAEEGMGGI